jgi:predicted ArsR family transcriptional regulator
MQETRRYILEILRDRKEATVDDIVTELQQRRGSITPVTVRHHLNELQKHDLITAPQLRHRNTPGRPQYVLTEGAKGQFPITYQPLTAHLMQQLKGQLPPREVNVILEGVATSMALEAQVPDAPLPQRLDAVVAYLNEHGYDAQWESHPDGYVLQTHNCPYHQLAEADHTLCEMDMRLVASLLGVVPRLIGRMSSGSISCAYMIPDRLIE